MFKKSRRKIVAAIMSVLVILWVGTLGVIYVSSYFEMVRQNQQMLKEHADMYVLPQSIKGNMPKETKPGDNLGFRPRFADTPMFRLSTFYTVALSYDGEIIDIKNNQSNIHTDDTLEKLAKDIVEKNRSMGTKKNLAFYRTDKKGYTLVVFMDNTVINKGAMTLFRYTLIFGGVSLVLFFFVSVFLARKIVQPLEEGYQKQKQFISDAGHELKTPISVVSANAELLSRELKDIGVFNSCPASEINCFCF